MTENDGRKRGQRDQQKLTRNAEKKRKEGRRQGNGGEETGRTKELLEK